MMRILKYILVLWVFVPNLLFSQPIGNEWIKPDQTYYRISIPKTGIYKISNIQLGAAVPNNSQHIQLFQNGIEIPCYIKGEATGLLEYIVFYAKKNDGQFDVEMYDDPIHQTNPNHSLINDTASVFLTYNTKGGNLRFTAETDVNFAGYTPKSYCWGEAYTEYSNAYYFGNDDSEYVAGEGWFDSQALNKGQKISKKLATPDFVNEGLNSQWDLGYISFSKGTIFNANRHHIKVTAPQLLSDTTFVNYKSIKITKAASITVLDTSTTVTFESIDDQKAESSKVAVSYIKLSYTRGFNAGNKSQFRIQSPASASAKSFIEVKNFKSENNAWLFDLSNNRYIKVLKNGNTLQALVPASSKRTDLLFIDESAFLSVESIKPVQMFDHYDRRTDYIIITHTKLMDQAERYRDYRNAYLVDVDELYNQFGYGIQKHPMAIRNFLKYVYKNWDTYPAHLFIIGKAIESYQIRYNAGLYTNCLVPTMGQFGSDALLSNRVVPGMGYEPSLATGRIAAQNNSDVEIYLNKVRDFENNVPAQWMKRGIHFGGGANSTEQAAFKRNLSNYEKVFNDTLFGGWISTFLKTSSVPIVMSKSDSIGGLIEGGVSLMTFFGHGNALNGFDQDIDEPETFNNTGKYPLIIANSCYSGNIHLNGKSSKSEDWVLIQDKGAIGFMAVVGRGYPESLDIFSQQFYENFARSNYAKTIGQNMKLAQKKLNQVISLNNSAKSTLHEFTLHGDPAVVLNSFPEPDLTINLADVTFIPEQITTEIDSFYIQIVATNQARTTNKKFTVEFTRKLPKEGKYSEHFYELNGLKFKDTSRIKLPVDKISGVGNNIFNIVINSSNAVEEKYKNNNSVELITNIKSSDLVPVVPYEYSYAKGSNIVLKASSVDPFAPEQSSIFEIDNSHIFNHNSPFYSSKEIVHKGGIIEWRPTVTLNSGETYFWRVAKKTDVKNWAESSFTIDENSVGWRQSNYGQMRDNNFRFIDLDSIHQTYHFTTAAKTLRCTNIGSPWNETQFRSIGFEVDQVGASSSCGPASAMIVVIIDSLTLFPWTSDIKAQGAIGHVNDPKCWNKQYAENYFIFPSDNINNIEKMVDFIENDVPDGNHILIYSFRNGNYTNYSPRILDAFESWGADGIRGLANNIPYIFYVKKGDLSTAIEEKGGFTDIIEQNIELKGNFNYGYFETKAIGPAKQWKSFSWSWDKAEENLEEIAFVRIYGIDIADHEKLLFDTISSPEFDLSTINAGSYPYLKLQFFTRDEASRTPAKLKHWEVLYDPVTDLAINPLKGYHFKADTLSEGENGYLTVAFENIGGVDTDSIWVNYWLQNGTNETPVTSHNIAPLKAGDYVIDSVDYTTLNQSGYNSLWLEINPAKARSNMNFIREQYYFNNLAQKSFYVKPDKTNPLLDVTFDGMHIMDGDLVSATPEISFIIKDENQYKPLNDTSIFSFYLKSQQTGIEQKIAVSNNPEVVFIPGETSSNKAQLIYKPTFTEDGIYELRVQAVDASKNPSGNTGKIGRTDTYEGDYLVSFQVITESTITNVFNYPNPFTTQTRFVFELTGSQIPDAMSIEILTVTGKVVKVIYLDELGPLHIGKNISEFAWNGTDMYGDRLANGVYFYRVKAKLNGKMLKIRNTGTDQYFKNGFGKMYIMR